MSVLLSWSRRCWPWLSTFTSSTSSLLLSTSSVIHRHLEVNMLAIAMKFCSAGSHSVEKEVPILTCASDLLCVHIKNQKVAQLRNRYHRYRQNAVQINCSTKGLSKSTKIISKSNKKVLPGFCVYISMSFIF